MTPAAASQRAGHQAGRPEEQPGRGPQPDQREEDPGAAVAVDEPQHEELHADDDRGVGGEREADGAGRHLADLPGERREPGLHLPVADEARQEGERGDPDDGRVAQDREVARCRPAPVASAGGWSGRPATCRSGPSSRPMGTSMQAASTRKIAVKVRRPVDVGEEPAEDAADADAEVDQGEVDAEELGAQGARDDARGQGVEPRPAHAEADAEQRERQHERRHGRGEGEHDRARPAGRRCPRPAPRASRAGR